jgi:hypothetical protein
MRLRLTFSVLLLALAAGAFAACATTITPAGGVTTTPAGQSWEVQVTVYNDRMNLSQATFSTGVPYHFVVTNRGTLPQECMLMPHAMGQMPMGDLRHQALMTTNEMLPGATRAFNYIFPAMMAAQQVQFSCYSNGQATMSRFMQIR